MSLQLSDDDRQELKKRARSRTLPASQVFHAQIVLALASGKTYHEIEKELGVNPATVALWKKRYEEDGLEGLISHPSVHASRTVPDDLRIQVLLLAEELNDRNSRRIAKQLGLSKSTVYRILNELGSSPQK